MNYQETIDYLFNVAPLFQNIGSGAYKEGLENTHTLDAHFGHPHQSFKTIHVAGTNGKGSCSHTLAAILQAAGYKVGLYTSPHLIDFRERIRVNGEMIPEQRVIDFVEQERAFFEPLYPSFFELTTTLAFQYFKEQQVDVAVIEVGLGGRLDCTNIITPDLSIITNISFDHTQFLGNTLAKIAGEKAGIIKKGVPVVFGETNGNADVRKVFEEKAVEMGSLYTFADENPEVMESELLDEGGRQYKTRSFGEFVGEMTGDYQVKNTNTILHALRYLQDAGYRITDEHVHEGFSHVTQLTGFQGRWQILGHNPLTVCDAGHNVGGLSYVSAQLQSIPVHKHIVLGMVSDKDINAGLEMFPKDATYYFTNASVKRAMPAAEIMLIGEKHGLKGNYYGSVAEAFEAARKHALPNEMIFIGGSCFIVADLLSYLTSLK